MGTVGTGQSPVVVPMISALPVSPPTVASAVSPVSSESSGDALPGFEALYEEHVAFAWRTARRMGVPPSSVEDVVQDVFLVLHRRLHEYDGRTPVRAWLLGIVARVVADHRRTFRRKQSRWLAQEDEDWVEQVASPRLAPSEGAEQAEALRLVVTLLEELEPGRREVLALFQIEQMTVPEIAATVGLNVNTAYARLRAGRQDFEAAYARHLARQPPRKP
jgi:RNA polymerase sigma-70 factor (ECF subfamily)